MKTGKRLLALVLVLAMLLTNLPVGAIAAELEELTTAPAETVTETERATEAAPEATDPPETTAAPETEAPTEAPSEAATEAAEDVTEAPAEETMEPSEEPTEATAGEELTATEEAVLETVAETEAVEENLPYLSFGAVYNDENGLYVDTSNYGTEFVNPYGSVTRVAFFLNEYVDGEWVMTNVQVEAVDDSISLELVEESITGADCYYIVTTNVAGVTSGVSYEDLNMNVSTWPYHFHFSTEASSDNSNAGLIYELDLDDLSESDSVDVYAVMFHEDFTWSNVRLSEDSQRFASLYQVSDSVYRISISGVARKHVMDNGYVNLEVLSTQTDNNTGDVNDNGYMYLPIFMTPNPGLVMVGVDDEGYDTGYYENPDYVSYQFMVPPGQRWNSIFYLREWDAEAGEMRISDPVDPALLKTDGDLTFTVIDSSKIREGEEHGEYFVCMTSNTFDQDYQEIYIEQEDGTRVGGVYYYTSRYHVAYYDSEVMSNDTFLGEYYVNPDGDSVLYVGFNDEDCGGTHRGVPNMDAYFGSVEATDTYGMYKITLSQDVVNDIRRGAFQWLYMNFDVDMDDGSTANYGAGIWLVANEEDFIPYLTYGWLEGSDEGLFEGDQHNDASYTIVPGDQYCHIYYVHTWDAEQGCYVEAPVPAEELYCDDGNFTIERITDWVKEGEVNADCFVGISAAEWDHESEIYTYVDGVRSDGVYVATYLPQLGFYSSEELSYDTYLHGEYVVDPDAEENSFYVGLYSDHWIIDGEPWLDPEDFNSLMSLEKRNDNVIKVTLTQEGIDAVLGGEELWPNVAFSVQNTVDENWTDTNYAGGLCVRANSEDITPADEGFYFRFLEDHGEGWFDPHNGDCFGTNIAKYDEYRLYFYLKLWDENLGQYVEIPVHPEHDGGIILNRVENVRDGEENGEYYYAVSIADDALDTEQAVWTEYEGVTYTMPITSGLHGVAVYTTEEPSHDTRLMAPLDVEPFGENVAYLATNGDWTITDVVVEDWASEYVYLEALSDTVWQVTLTEAGINQNMSQWILDIGMNVEIQNVEDSNWTEEHWMNVAFSRENLEMLAQFGMDSGDYWVIDGGYIREWFTGEYGSDDNGGSWQIWDSEVLTELADGLSYDYTTNTLTMENYDGEWMTFQYGWTDDDGTFWASLPSDTLTIELIGDNSLIAENHHALDLYNGLNAVITGDGSLLLKTVNNFAQDGDGNARVFDTFPMNGGNLTIEGNASVTVEIAGEGNESCWEGDTWLGDRAAGMTALAMGHGQLYIKDNAYLETVIPEGADRNGSVDVGEENAIWGERFPGGYRGIADTFLLKVMGGTLVTQSLEFGSGYHDDGTFWTNNYAQTGGEVIIQATGWNNILEEDGVTQHTHYEGLSVRQGGTAGIWGGTLTVNVEATDAQLASSVYYEAVCIRGGELEIGGDAEVTIEANNDRGNLLGVFCEDGTGKLNISGGTLNVNGSTGEGNGRSGIYLDHETVFTMSDGTINSEYADFTNHGPVHITGGTINIGGLYWYDTMIDDRGIPYAWVTGFHAGGPEFTFDGGTINVDGGHFVAGGMVGMNGGEINITNGSLQVNTAFALNDGVINISNPGSEISEYNGEPAHIWPALWVNSYFSIGGSDIENAAPALNITDHQIPSMAARVDGTYHQMAGSTVNLTHTGTEKAGIYVATQFDENGEPLYATDEEGNLILDEEGNPVILSGSFLMNDGILNVMNPGDWGAELIRAMEADPHSFVQFRGGKTTFDTAQIFWNGETHITENAVVEVKDTAILANAGHLVMDDGTLLANEESAVCLGMSEMNGGKMELDNAMILVNAGFHFNNGEIVINNTDDTINTEAVFTSLAANTYFAIGNPENPDSNPKLTINHNLTGCPAVQVNGTMHLMAGTVELNVPVTKAPAISISAPIVDENGAPIKTDDQGNAIGGEFLQNGGVLNINAAEEDNIAGIIAAEGSVFFMNGGETNFNGTNMVMSGKMFLNDTAVLNVNEGIVRLYETASLEVDHGTMNVTATSVIAEDGEWAFKVEPGAEMHLKNGALTINNEAYLTALQLDGKLTLDGEAQLNVYATGTEQQYNENGEWIWRFGVYAGEDSEIVVNGGTINVGATDVNGAFVAWGDFTQTGGTMNLSNMDESGTYEGENAIEANGPTVISGGVMNLVSTDTGFSNNSVEELDQGSRVTISGGTINIEVPRLAMFLCSSTTISGGDVNIQLSNYYSKVVEDGTVLGLQRYAQGIFLYGVDNPEATLNITGGDIDIVIDEPEQETEYWSVQSIFVVQASANITGGLIRANGGRVFFHSNDASHRLNLGDMVVYSLSSGQHLQQLNWSEAYTDGNYYYSWFNEDNDPESINSGVHAEDLVIVTSKAGTNTTWELENGILTFQSTENIGGMYDYTADAPAPWYWLHDFITIVEMDTHLGYIGNYAFNGLDKLTKLVFLGEAPNFAEKAFAGVDTDAFYPVETDSWTTEKMQDYGGNIAWLLNYQSVEVVEILTDKDVLFSGEKTTLNAQQYPELEEKPDVVWTLAEGDSAYATLTVKNNVATVTAKTVTEKQVVTVYAVAENGLAQPVAKTLTFYPKAQSVSIFDGETDVTGAKIKVDLLNVSELDLKAVLNPDDAAEYLIPAVTWTSSAAKVATVDENGVVSFTGTAGTVKITATAADGSKKKAVVTITALEMIQNIEMASGSADEILGGKSATYTAVDENGTKLKASQVTWSMSDEYAPYASINAKGKLTTKVVQEAVQVTIVGRLVDNPQETYVTHVVTIRPATAVMQLEHNGMNVTGDTIYVDTDGYDADGLPVISLNAVAYPDGSFEDATWKSSSTAIAKVEDGVVTGVWNSKTGAVKTGTVTITATATDGSKKNASVKLQFGIFAQDVEITSTEETIVSGQSMTLTAETFPEKPTSTGVVWSLKNASDKSYLSVTAAGKVKAKTVYGPTEVTLVARSKDGQAEPAEMTLTVLPKSDSILVIKSGEDYVTKTTQILDLNGDASITLSAHTLNGGQETVTWTPATSKLGTIVKNDDGTLTVSMTKAGSMTVTAKASDGRKATVTLKAAKLATGVTLKDKATGAADGLTLTAGKTMTLVPTIENAGKAAVIWSVEPSGIATITSAGKLTASTALAYEQIVTVTATANDGSGAEGSVEILVKPQVQGIQIHGLSGELTNTTVTYDMVEDPEIQLSAQTFPADAADAVTWKSSSAKVATVDENGKITCVKNGTVTITATATDGSGKKATFKLTVVKRVAELSMAKTALVAGGKSLTLKAEALPADAANKAVTWSMTGDTAYATLSAKGVLKTSAVTAPKTVYVTAQAKDGSGKTATCAVTIYPATTSLQVLYNGETVTGKTVEIQAGQSITLEGSSLPVSAAEAYTWKSSGAAATVTEDGEVTGKTAGSTVTITCTAADGSGKKATVKIKVVPAV